MALLIALAERENHYFPPGTIISDMAIFHPIGQQHSAVYSLQSIA